ncbi:hypothetical protein VNO78_13130 [Psophocarpus tetragonolobus]|uniref:Uncharacterized protein n=1 Tax=Psophocarpus tetragonolobus TaxID=3891 RepID=A0AAN9XPD9_PSOTE
MRPEGVDRNIDSQNAIEPWKALVLAIATRRDHDSDFKRVISSYHQAKREAQNADDKLDKANESVFRLLFPSQDEAERVREKLDEVTKFALSKVTWLLALGIGEATSGPHREASSVDENLDEASMSVKLSNLKSDILDYYTHIDNDVCFCNKILEKARSYTEKLLEESENVEPVKSITEKALPR